MTAARRWEWRWSLNLDRLSGVLEGSGQRLGGDLTADCRTSCWLHVQGVQKEMEDESGRQGPVILSRKRCHMMVVVEEEMQRGWMERTWPSRNGQDLGTRERRGSTMVHQEGPAVTQPQQSGSRAGWKGGG